MLEKLIKKCDYEWDSDIEKKIQERIDYWVDCYPDDVEIIIKDDGKLGYLIPSDVKNDLWRDILTSIFDIHNDDIIKKLKIKTIE